MIPSALIAQPDAVFIDRDDGVGPVAATRGGAGWSVGSTLVTATVVNGRVVLSLASPGSAVAEVQVRWKQAIAPGIRLLGDHWERGYGDLEWRGLVAERVMPWHMISAVMLTMWAWRILRRLTTSVICMRLWSSFCWTWTAKIET